jgi:hypothetical protein
MGPVPFLHGMRVTCGGHLELDTNRLVGGGVRRHGHAERCPSRISHLNVAQAQLGLDARVEQQADTLRGSWPQAPPAGSELVQGKALDVLKRIMRPVQCRAVEYVGVRDDPVRHSCECTGYWHRVPSVPADCRTDTSGHDQGGGVGLARLSHSHRFETTRSAHRCACGKEEQQRRGCHAIALLLAPTTTRV